MIFKKIRLVSQEMISQEKNYIFRCKQKAFGTFMFSFYYTSTYISSGLVFPSWVDCCYSDQLWLWRKHLFNKQFLYPILNTDSLGSNINHISAAMFFCKCFLLIFSKFWGLKIRVQHCLGLICFQSNPKNVLKMVASEMFFKVNSTPDNVPKNVWTAVAEAFFSFDCWNWSEKYHKHKYSRILFQICNYNSSFDPLVRGYAFGVHPMG